MPEKDGQIYDIEFIENDGERSQKDEEFVEIVHAEAISLYERSVKYLMPVLNTNNQEYSENPFLNLIAISSNGGVGYKVRVEMHFEKEDYLHWWVTFNIPHPFPPFPAGNERIYYPVELGRYVE
ncbi:MAG: hypothetical protein AB2688_11610 [Candidatus Thiodiazotropha taylori]|nr:hypothetical protein [Candidatus Thiodiazotropha taylori]MCW4319671.1 hypothetical protein [Candidatus Thiodiazotropha taylori]